MVRIMTHQNHSLHTYMKSKKKMTKFDQFINVAAFLYPISGIPQVIEVYNGNTAGVSLFSWVGFMFFSGLFLIYGLIHKVKPMIINNSLWFVVDVLVIIGLCTAN